VILWVDAQLSPSLAPWIQATFGIEAYSVRFLGLRDADDPEIFQRGRSAGAVVLTKDSDFVELLSRFGPPPQVLWVTLGNTSNARMREVFTAHLSAAVRLLESGEALVEISEPTL
jgi:predicted nuclease of predicted toxin-antitoxin system